MNNTNNNAVIKKYCVSDDTELVYRHWECANKIKGVYQRVYVLLHRGHEHSGRLLSLADALHGDDSSVFAWDARGHGLSQGERGYAENFGVLVKDLDEFIQHICRDYGISINNIAVVAQSVGAVIAATWVHDYAPKIRSLVLASPAFRVKLYVPLAIPSLRLAYKFGLMKTVKSYVKSQVLTHDKTRQDSYDSDELVSPVIATNILLGLYDAGTRLIEDAGAITVPTLLLTSGSDWVVRKDVQRTFFERLGSTQKEMHELRGFFHDTFGEQDAQRPLSLAKNFMDQCFDSPLDYQPNIPYTKEEFYLLSATTSLLKSVSFSITKFLMFSLGRLSNGIDLGVRTGFDSGAMLEYVYEDKANGQLLVGEWMDRAYLDSPGWKGIRVRSEHIQQSLMMVSDKLLETNQEIKLVDIATGHGRYILEALANVGLLTANILLRDFDPDNVIAAGKKADVLGFSHCETAVGDAFDSESMNNIPADRTVGVVSGLYELFPDNASVEASLQDLAEKIVDGGYLIYTGQPYHPQLEFIARVLTSHRGGQDWVMRRRTQAELDQLVEQAGFEKIDMLIDEWGIFTVSIARKVPKASLHYLEEL